MRANAVLGFKAISIVGADTVCPPPFFFDCTWAQLSAKRS